MNKLPKTIRINFFGTLDTNQKLAETGVCSIKRKQLDLAKRDLWHFNLPWTHSLLPSSAVTLKTTATHIPGISTQYPGQQNRLYSQRIVSVYFNVPGHFLKGQLKGLTFI